MGDTGSLALGGAIAGLAIMTNTAMLLILIGGIFVIEALSVLIQVFWFRVFHKRVFKMAPIHHHFELEAWSETKIMLRFWIVAAACGAIGFTVYQIEHPSPLEQLGPPSERGSSRLSWRTRRTTPDAAAYETKATPTRAPRAAFRRRSSTGS